MHYSKEEKAMWLEDWRRSGKSAHRYAKENGLTPWTFIRWTKAETETERCFVEIPVQGLQPIQPAPEILIEKRDVKIRIPLLIGCNELRAVLEGLGASL